MEIQSHGRIAAPCGGWGSPITAELVARGVVSLHSPSLDGGELWWLEGRPVEGGRVVLVKAGADGDPVDVTPPGFNVRSMVHEYGGGAYCLHDGAVYFTNFDDQRLYRQDPGVPPRAITEDVSDKRHRYADGRVTADGTLWIGVRERHEGDTPTDVVNELVAVPTDGREGPRVIAGGRDFYAAPRISPDGSRLSFLAWDLPWMPWDGCELFVASLGADGTLGEPARVAGRDGEEAIWQPEWSPAGDLVFASDRSGWWNLERVRDAERTVLHEAEAEFGYPAWSLGTSSFAFLGDGRIACVHDRDGRSSFGVLDPETGQLEPFDLPHDALWSGPYVVAQGDEVALVAGSSTIPVQVVRLDVRTRSWDAAQTSAQVPVDTSYFSVPEAIEFTTENGLTAHALYYPPTNPDHTPLDGELPPLIVDSHGGPTSNATPVFALGTQYWTSRGFAVVDVNYGGSTGYGRAYRQRLNGQWGVVDLADCVNASRFLVERGDADGERVLIHGGSAGGYTTVCALTFTDRFAAGASYFGLADLVPFANGDTHKFESKYEHTLVGPYPEAAAVYRERSPINFADRIRTPMLVLQGADDDVVPQSQAELIVRALREHGVPHAYLLFEGEGHGFRKAENIVRSLEAELSFYAQVLGFELGDAVPKLAIENL